MFLEMNYFLDLQDYFKEQPNMKSRLLFIPTFLILSFVIGQEKNWSIELNYAIFPTDGFGANDNGIDFGFKYRFVKKMIFNLGLSSNFGLFNESLTLPIQTDDSTNYIFNQGYSLK